MPHVTISSTMDFNVAKIQRAHRHEIVDDIVTCGKSFNVGDTREANRIL